MTGLAADVADGVLRGAETLGGVVSSPFAEPTLRLGVTGLARAGKTVFITSLVANLMNRGRMAQLSAERDGRIEAAYLQPQPDDTVPRFYFENHLGALTGPERRTPGQRIEIASVSPFGFSVPERQPSSRFSSTRS